MGKQPNGFASYLRDHILRNGDAGLRRARTPFVLAKSAPRPRNDTSPPPPPLAHPLAHESHSECCSALRRRHNACRSRSAIFGVNAVVVAAPDFSVSFLTPGTWLSCRGKTRPAMQGWCGASHTRELVPPRFLLNDESFVVCILVYARPVLRGLARVEFGAAVSNHKLAICGTG